MRCDHTQTTNAQVDRVSMRRSRARQARRRQLIARAGGGRAVRALVTHLMVMVPIDARMSERWSSRSRADGWMVQQHQTTMNKHGENCGPSSRVHSRTAHRIVIARSPHARRITRASPTPRLPTMCDVWCCCWLLTECRRSDDRSAFTADVSSEDFASLMK
jgi:hypothetical protein